MAGKIYHFEEMEEFFGGDDWKIQINIVDIWNKYSNKELTLEQFNKEYRDRLIKYKEEITNLGNDVWNDIVPLINKMNENKEEEQIFSLYEDVYDWADKNDILIKTK